MLCNMYWLYQNSPPNNIIKLTVGLIALQLHTSCFSFHRLWLLTYILIFTWRYTSIISLLLIPYTVRYLLEQLKKENLCLPYRSLSLELCVSSCTVSFSLLLHNFCLISFLIISWIQADNELSSALVCLEKNIYFTLFLSVVFVAKIFLFQSFKNVLWCLPASIGSDSKTLAILRFVSIYVVCFFSLVVFKIYF